MIERRSILTGLVALVAAPAIIKVGSIMPINSGLVPRKLGWRLVGEDGYLRHFYVGARGGGESSAMRGITEYKLGDEVRLDVLYGSTDKSVSSEDVRLLMERQVEHAERLVRIRLPNDYVVSDGPSLSIQNVTEHWLTFRDPQPEFKIPTPLALAAAAVAVAPAILEKPVNAKVLE